MWVTIGVVVVVAVLCALSAFLRRRPKDVMYPSPKIKHPLTAAEVEVDDVSRWDWITRGHDAQTWRGGGPPRDR